MAKHRSPQPISAIKISRSRRRLYEMTDDTAVTSSSRATAAQQILFDYVALASGVALIPVPVVDIVAVTTINLKMLQRLCQEYRLDFREQRAKAVIGALLGTLQVRLLIRSVVKFLPGLGLGAGLLATSALAGAMTFALGKVFVLHFESGGTLLDFDPNKMRAYFQRQYDAGRAM